MTYSTKAVADLLGWSPDRVRRFVRNGLVKPARVGGRYRFAFSDIVLFRTAHELESKAISPRRLLRVLRTLRQQMPDGKPLSTVRLAARGHQVVATQGNITWEPGSGQIELQLSAGPVSGVEQIDQSKPPTTELDERYNQAIDLEARDISAAMEAYIDVLEADPQHYDARINVGRIYQVRGDYDLAQAQYEAALNLKPGSALALFNLGTLSEARGQADVAISYYEQAGDDLADAHFNLAHLYEARGEIQLAIRHLRHYQRMQTNWHEVDPKNE